MITISGMKLLLLFLKVSLFFFCKIPLTSDHFQKKTIDEILLKQILLAKKETLWFAFEFFEHYWEAGSSFFGLQLQLRNFFWELEFCKTARTDINFFSHKEFKLFLYIGESNEISLFFDLGGI